MHFDIQASNKNSMVISKSYKVETTFGGFDCI